MIQTQSTIHNPRLWSIYALRAPLQDPVLYVGKSVNPDKRARQHQSDRKRPFVMSILETGFGKQAWKEAEKKWINHYRALGECSLNIANGGYGNDMQSEATKAKIRLKNLGKIVSESTRLKLSIANKGKIMSQEARSKISAISKSCWARPEYVQKLKYTDEMRKRLSEIATMRWSTASPEYRQQHAIRTSHTSHMAWVNASHEKREERKFILAEGRRNNFSLERKQEQARINGAKSANKPGMAEERRKTSTAWWASLTTEQIATFKSNREEKLRVVMSEMRLARQAAKVEKPKEKFIAELNGPDGPFCSRGHKRWSVDNGHKRCLSCIVYNRISRKLAREAAKVAESKQ